MPVCTHLADIYRKGMGLKNTSKLAGIFIQAHKSSHWYQVVLSFHILKEEIILVIDWNEEWYAVDNSLWVVGDSAYKAVSEGSGFGSVLINV